jgi:hypothetical protein
MAASHGDVSGALPAELPSLHLQFPNTDHANISPLTKGAAGAVPEGFGGTVTEGTMTKESNISLIAGAALFAVAVISIACVFDGRLSFDNQPDAMVTQLYTTTVASTDRQQDTLASNVPPAGYHVPR